jgi:GAF domain-containing protein/HAMP domain-containing protein
MKTSTKIRRGPRSLTTTLAVAFLVLSVVVLLISSVLQAFSSITTQQQVIAGKLQLIAQAASQPVSSFIRDKFRALEIAAGRDSLPAKSPAEQKQILEGLLGTELAFRQLVALNTEDQPTAQASRLSQAMSGQFSDFFTDELFTQVKQGKEYISSVYIDPNTSEPLIFVAVPAKSALGDYEGTLAAEVNLKFMWDVVDQLKVGESGLAYVVDDQGNLLAFGDTARVLKGENVQNLQEVRQFVADPISANNGVTGIAPGILGTTVVGTYAPLGTPPWAVVTELPWEEAYRDVIQQILVSIVITIVVATLAGFAGAYLARRLARPLVSLTGTATRIADGEIELQAAVAGTSEVTSLATAFNSMTAQLRTFIGELEQRVAARTAQLRASAEVGRAVTSILEPDQLLKQVVDLITERFGFYYSAIFVLDRNGQQAVLRAATGEAGQILLDRSHRLSVDEQSMVGGAIVTRTARIALDVGQGAVRFANPLLPDTRSEIALPLRVGDRVLGALDVQSKEAGAFDEASAEVLQTMADQIAIALFNAETFRRAEQHTTTMAQLNQLSRELATATSLEHVALVIVPAITNLLGTQRLAIAQKTANPQILAFREFRANPDRPVSDAALIQSEGSMIGECIVRGETVYNADLSQSIDRYSDVADVYRQGLRSGVTLPLRVGERVLGTFNVGTDRTEAYSPEQINQLEQVASQLAITIENLNLAEQTQQTLAELDAANRQLIGQAWGTYTQTTKLETAEWRNGIWSVLESGTTPRETSQALVPAALPLSLPIKVRGTTIGEFNIAGADAQQIWDVEDMTFAQSLVDQVGQVLETARLLDETQRTAQREKAVANAADKIHRSTDIESVLQSAVTEIQRITGRRGISVQLGFGRTTPPGNRASGGDTGGDQ